jgi:hypothetical protein
MQITVNNHRQFKLLLLVICHLAFLFGCAAQDQSGMIEGYMQGNQKELSNALFDNIFRSDDLFISDHGKLNYTITDPQTVGRLTDFSQPLKSLSQDRVLEYELLRMIALARSEDEIPGQLEKFWETSPAVRKFKYGEINYILSPQYIGPLCLLAYLSDYSGLFDATAISRLLKEIPTSQMKGYAFRFYLYSQIRAADWTRIDELLACLYKITARNKKVFRHALNIIKERAEQGNAKNREKVYNAVCKYHSAEIADRARSGSIETAENLIERYDFCSRSNSWSRAREAVRKVKECQQAIRQNGFIPLPKHKVAINTKPLEAGRMNFNTAQQACIDKDGRLPTKKEIAAAYNASISNFSISAAGEFCWDKQPGSNHEGQMGICRAWPGRRKKITFTPFVASFGAQVMDDVAYRCAKKWSSFQCK